MNTKKILKFYLFATISLSSVAALTLNDTFRSYIPAYYTSVLETKALPTVVDSDSKFYRKNPAEIMFIIGGDSGKSLVRAGTKNADFMNLSFKIGHTNVQLNGIAFKIIGATGKNIKNAYLVDDEAIVATASITNDKIKFPNMGYLMNANSDSNLQLKLDLGEELKVGQIVSLEVENPYDINMTVAGGNYSLNGHYPIRGKYLSIIR
jgi:hypothetical protein